MNRSSVITLIWIGVSGSIIISMIQGLGTYSKATSRLQEQQLEVQRLKQENAVLLEKVQFEQTEFAKEKRARTQLGVGLPNEERVVFVSPSPTPTLNIDQAETSPAILGEQNVQSDGLMGSIQGFINSITTGVSDIYFRLVEHFSIE